MKTKLEIARDWLPRYTGTPLEGLGEHILLTNFFNYLVKISQRFDTPILGEGGPMQTVTNTDGLTLVNFGMGSANAATIMDLLVACKPRGVLFLGKCGGLKRSAEIGRFILPITAIRGEGTSNDYTPPEVPALPSVQAPQVRLEHGFAVPSGVPDRGDLHDEPPRLGVGEQFRERLRLLSAIGIDMETATVFIVGHVNQIPRGGALLLVSDAPMTPEGIKTQESDKAVTARYTDLHLDIGIRAMTEIGQRGEEIKHFGY